MDDIRSRISAIRDSIARIAAVNGRNPENIKLIAVSKTYPVGAIEAAFETGQRIFGENRPQEMKEKFEILSEKGGFESIEWHLIGQLQKNKVKYIAPFVHTIHSLDDEELLAEIQKQATRNNRIIRCLIQINISEEGQKSGVNEQEALELLRKSNAYPNVKITGLMGMASFTEDENLIRRQFRRLSEAMVFLNSGWPAEGNEVLTECSMGMSGDYEIAIAEGATYIRIGTAIFGHR